MRCRFFIANKPAEKRVHLVPKFPHRPNVNEAFSDSATKTPVSPVRQDKNKESPL